MPYEYDERVCGNHSGSFHETLVLLDCAPPNAVGLFTYVKRLFQQYQIVRKTSHTNNAAFCKMLMA